MDFSILIYTNSAYSYLWPIIRDYCNKYFCNLKVYIGTNKQILNFARELIYDEKDNYTKRLLTLFEQIDEKYLLFIHDVDILINLNLNILPEYLECIEMNNIDRLSLGVFNQNNNEIIKHKNIQICNIGNINSKNFITPYDVAPSIWNLKSLTTFFKNFSTSNYDLEFNPNAQNYFKQFMKSYGIQKNENINLVYHRGFVYCEDFNFLHITIKGKALPLKYYYDLQQIFLKYLKDYNLNFEEHQDSSIDKNIL